MVKSLKQSIFIISLFFVIFANIQQALAASFEASVNRNEIAAGQSFKLKLSLSGASAKSAPDFSPLEKDFTIISRSQSSQTTIINGNVSSSINWQLTLIAPKEGEYTIPPITISTNAGKLKSNKIKLSVNDNSALSTLSSSKSGKTATIQALLAEAKIDKKSPYQNEPVLYTAKLIAARNIADISISELKVENAIVEKQGEPKIYDAQIKGTPVKIVEVRYLITPLKSGKIEIPAFVFQGQVESATKRRNQRHSLFDDPFFNDPFFDNSFFGMRDPFTIFDKLNSYEPFAVAGNKIELNVKAPAAKMDPWLPLSSLEISHHLEGASSAKVGEPLTLTLTMVAKGAVGSILPSLEEQITATNDFKIYADKPQISESISDDEKNITGWREESYSIIPQKSGELTLPEIKVSWWDVTKNQIAYTTIAAQKINVEAGSPTSGGQAEKQASEQSPKPQIKKMQKQNIKETKEASSAPVKIEQKASLPHYIYVILTIGAVFIILLSGAVLYLWQKISKQDKDPAPRKEPVVSPANEDKISLNKIKSAKTAQELKDMLQIFAHQHWNTPRNASLVEIYETISERSPENIVNSNKLFTDLDKLLYAGDGANADFQAIKIGIYTALKSAYNIRKKQKNSCDNAKIRKINPS